MPAGHGRRRVRGHGPLTFPPRGRLAWVALVVAGSAPLAGAQTDPAAPTTGDPPRPRLVDQVTVTAARSHARTGDTPASVAVVDRAALDTTAAPTVDDALRQVVGFSLFRRVGSRTANPTVQGVSCLLYTSDAADDTSEV